MRRMMTWTAAVLCLAAAVLPARGLDPGTIVAERPVIGGAATYGTQAAQRQVWVWGRVADNVHVRWVLAQPPSNYWDPLHLNQISVGPCTACDIYATGDSSYSFDPSKTWTTEAAWGTTCYKHANYNPARPLYWTCPAGKTYTHVLGAFFYHATVASDLTVALTGSGTLVRATLDGTTAASPWNGKLMATQRYVVLATNVTAGDVITITPAANSKTQYCSPIIGVVGGDVEPSVAGALQLGPSLIYAGESALDARVIDLVLQADLRGCGTAFLPVNTLNPGGPVGGFAYTPAHSATTQRVTKAGDDTLPPIETALQIDGTYPNGTAWAPSVGTKTVMKALAISSVGQAIMFEDVVGTWDELLYIGGDGFRQTNRLVFNAAAEAAGLELKTAAYPWMIALGSAPGWVECPGELARTQLILDDDSLSPGFQGGEVVFGGGSMGSVLAKVGAIRTPYSMVGSGAIQQRTTLENKAYFRNSNAGAANLDVVNGTVVVCGGYIQVYPAPASSAPTMWWPFSPRGRVR